MSQESDDPERDPIDAARADWKASTTALERVQQVIERTTTPRSAREVAAEALVSEPTARKHLGSLADVGTVTTTTGGAATKYARDEDRLLYRRIRELATEHSRDELIEHIQEMKRRIDEYGAEYDAVSPEELATAIDGGESDAWEAVSEWQTTERNLHIAQAAINYGRARDLGTATQ